MSRNSYFSINFQLSTFFFSNVTENTSQTKNMTKNPIRIRISLQFLLIIQQYSFITVRCVCFYSISIVNHFEISSYAWKIYKNWKPINQHSNRNKVWNIYLQIILRNLLKLHEKIFGFRFIVFGKTLEGFPFSQTIFSTVLAAFLLKGFQFKWLKLIWPIARPNRTLHSILRVSLN